ncbi:hypothetical protein I2I05_09700 [Hymenobacter sp. BT683]|uniref:GTA TIM-barrel-like domain-containing protein n=1 Tax=Hymenobacter jeongseonensis TaxID=2791027 RepID=A0ABS0IIB7_9BACT|nr:hypothetical protein [Hymenobacter jeongseonensis]MBF9237668.1 hypothetical protein [Hymenobacter jeongseonensis]
MPQPLFSWRRGWPLVLLGLVSLLAFWGLSYSQEQRREPNLTPQETTAGLPLAPNDFQKRNPTAFDSTRLRGVSWVGGDSATAAEMEPLRKAHVTWIAQMPFGWQAGAAEPLIRVRTERRPSRGGYWGESDAGLLHTAQLAHQHGIRTLLKPHLWVRGNGTWPGDINMTSEKDWDTWFASYASYILHYAEVAEKGHFDGLCIGTELLHATEPAHDKAWRRLIRQIRRVYHGPLTYAANWSGEYQQVTFWDALDYVGIQAYFPLSTTNAPSLEALMLGWQPHLRELALWQKKIKKPIVFTEVGYKTTPDAAIRPWEWPERTATVATPDETTQARCYEALFRACWGLPWLKGMFIWKWYPGLAPDGPGRRHADFTPQHKPAEAVLARWYGQ